MDATQKIKINVVVAERSYRITVNSSDEEKVRKAVDLVNQNVKRNKENNVYRDFQDLLSMTKELKRIEKADIRGFDFFDKLESCKKIGTVTIFSLNHDLLIEKYLGGKLYTPFKKLKDRIREFVPNKKWSNKKFSLYKLHGSINWYYATKSVSIDSNDTILEIDCEYLQCDINELCCHTGVYSHYNLLGILTGSYIKENKYCTIPYKYLFDKFDKKLHETHTLFISGYGWKDDGINRRILDWMETSDKRRMVIFSREISSVDYKRTEKDPPAALHKNWDIWINEKRIILVEKWISESCLSDIICYNR